MVCRPRAGAGNGKGAFTPAKSTATGGVSRKLRSHDCFAGSFNWTRPTGDGIRDQYTAEVFYRFYLSERLAFTPDVQWVISPALNPDASSIWLFGIRARIDF
jgi:porin